MNDRTVKINTRLNDEVRRALDHASVKTAFAQQSLDAMGGTADALAALMKDELTKWRKVVKESGM